MGYQKDGLQSEIFGGFCFLRFLVVLLLLFQGGCLWVFFFFLAMWHLDPLPVFGSSPLLGVWLNGQSHFTLPTLKHYILDFSDSVTAKSSRPPKFSKQTRLAPNIDLEVSDTS